MVQAGVGHQSDLALFQSPCVSVYRHPAQEYELAYQVLLWDSCPCEADCTGLPAALASIGPWAFEALPLTTTYDPLQECTVLEVAAYVDQVGPAPVCPTHLVPRQREPDPPPAVEPPPPPVRKHRTLRRVGTVLVFASLITATTVVGKGAMVAPPPAGAQDAFDSDWDVLATRFGLTCTTSGQTGICTDAEGRAWVTSAYLGPYGSLRYELGLNDERILTLHVFRDRDRYQRYLNRTAGQVGRYALDTPHGPALLSAPDMTPEGEANLLRLGARKL